MERITCKDIYGKKIFIFENHATAFYVWATNYPLNGSKPYLITLDHHTDTLLAFCRFAYNSCEGETDKAITLQQQLLKDIDLSDCNSISSAVDKLKHDEHIDAAIKTGIISHSFSLQLMEPTGTLSNEEIEYFKIDQIERMVNQIPRPDGPYTYSMPQDKMFIIPPYKSITDQDLLNNKNWVLEDFYLQKQIDIIKCVMRSSGLACSSPYILDIDLDYFQTLKSVYPDTTNLFYGLIRNASYITIAKESSCVEMLKVEGESINSEMLLDRILHHIFCALSL